MTMGRVFILIAVLVSAASVLFAPAPEEPTPANFKAPTWECPQDYHLTYDAKNRLFGCCKALGDCYWEQSVEQLRWLDALFIKVLATGNPLSMSTAADGGVAGASWFENPKLLKRYHVHRKIMNRIARESRRANRR